MIKKRRLRQEVRKLSRTIVFLVVFGFIFAFLFLYSYGQVNTIENKKLYGNELASQKAVDVFVNVHSNHIPIIILDDNEIYTCEGGFLNFPFNVVDLDGDTITGSIVPTNPFYLIAGSKPDSFNNPFNIVSGILSKDDAGGVNNGFKKYLETILMSDSYAVASKDVNITVIEINNPPVIDNIGVRTIWTHGDNSIFNYQVRANDIEDGNSNSGKLGFNISFDSVKLFNISESGTMYFAPNSSQIGVYYIRVCVNDTGILNPHPNISLCNSDGKSLYSCDDFSLTVTDKNRAPEIRDYFPGNLSINFSDGENVYFNLTAHDPDGNKVDVYWYVDEVLRKYDSLVDTSNFSFSYICGFNGDSHIRAVVTDGELNSSVQWNLSVSRAACLPDGPSGGGSGGGVSCVPKWVCHDWSECQNLKENYDTGKVNYKINTLIKDRCSLFKWEENNCGFQLRDCIDLKKCKSNLSMPGIMQECQYTKNPSCSDGTRNCHNGSCEILTDCGGPCSPCPTCNDGVKNQDEEGIDCGGVCPVCKEIPLARINYFNILMIVSLIFLIFAIIAISILGVKYIMLQKKIGNLSEESSLHQGLAKHSYRNGTTTSWSDFSDQN
jgi:hypothetical protein